MRPYPLEGEVCGEAGGRDGVCLSASGSRPSAGSWRGGGLERDPEAEHLFEQGGQVGDTGSLAADGLTAEVEEARRPVPGLVLHRVRVKRGTLRRGQTVRAVVDEGRRRMTAKSR